MNGQFCGMGHYKTNHGDVYIGQFSNNKFNGKVIRKLNNSLQGQLSYKDGSIYNGLFVDGLKHGMGLILYQNGDKYEGNFSNDEIDGEGEYNSVSGSEVKGKWKNGTILEKFDQQGSI